ncbi:MAG: BON domain-containing protein [Caldilineaceae bacterium]|nr:BON domain-containing protein [Caldilineaceae bacterium]
MGLLDRWFGAKYNDDQLISHAQVAVEEDPLINSAAGVRINSQQGVITLTGKVYRLAEKDRIEGVVRSALRATGAKFERIINEIQVG